MPGFPHLSGAPGTDDVVQQGGGRRFPPVHWRPSRGAALLAAAALLAGLAAGYAAGERHTAGGRAGGARPARHTAAGGFPAGSDSPGASGSSVTAAPVLTQSSAGCSAQRGRDLQLGVQVTNQSATAAIVRDVTAVLPLGGLRAIGQQWAPCGALPGGQYPAGNRLSPGGSIWVTFTFAVLVRCPGPLPVQFAVDYDWRGQREAARLPGFPDLGEVPYSGCRSR